MSTPYLPPNWRDMNRPELLKLLRRAIGMAAAIEMQLYMLDKDDADRLLRGVRYLKDYQRLIETAEDSDDDEQLDDPDLR